MARRPGIPRPRELSQRLVHKRRWLMLVRHLPNEDLRCVLNSRMRSRIPLQVCRASDRIVRFLFVFGYREIEVGFRYVRHNFMYQTQVLT